MGSALGFESGLNGSTLELILRDGVITSQGAVTWSKLCAEKGTERKEKHKERKSGRSQQKYLG